MATQQAADPPNVELLDSYGRLLSLVRTREAVTRPELSARTGLGRTAITQRTTVLLDAGLLEEGELNASTGGRQARSLRFAKNAGRILCAELGATGFAVGIADLTGAIRASKHVECAIALGPERVLGEVEQALDELLVSVGCGRESVWGVGIGVPGPVEFATGRPSEPPIMPGWNNYGVRERLSARYQVPVWVDNEVNMLCLGELRSPGGSVDGDLLYIKIGTGIGAGISSAGQLHRGAQGCAGDIGHAAVSDDSAVICRCGKTGCLEALAGGAALARDAEALASGGHSGLLAKILSDKGTLRSLDVAAAAQAGDHQAVQLLTLAGKRIGSMLATLVNFYNPQVILLGGRVADAGDLFLASIRETIYRRSLPLSTRELRIDRARLGDEGGLIGAAYMVLDELFAARHLGHWLSAGSPAGMPNLTD